MAADMLKIRLNYICVPDFYRLVGNVPSAIVKMLTSPCIHRLHYVCVDSTHLISYTIIVIVIITIIVIVTIIVMIIIVIVIVIFCFRNLHLRRTKDSELDAPLLKILEAGQGIPGP